MLNESLRKKLLVYKRRGTIMRPLALQMSKIRDDNKGLISLMTDPLNVYKHVGVVLIPIVANEHYHLLVLDKEYLH